MASYSTDVQKAFIAIVSGRVQRVMYRDFVQRKGSSLGLVGAVENLPDKTVSVYAEGARESLEKLIELLHKGPLFAKVTGVSVEWVSPRGGYQRFSITY